MEPARQLDAAINLDSIASHENIKAVAFLQ